MPRRSRTRATSGRSATPRAAIISAYSHDFSETATAAQVVSAAVSRSSHYAGVLQHEIALPHDEHLPLCDVAAEFPVMSLPE